MKIFSLEDCSVPEPNTGCFLWIAGMRDRKGYGRLRWKGAVRLAHRVSYELYRGPIPDEMLVCHTCDTPACINPAHLFLGTNADNTRDRNRKGRQAYGERNGKAILTADVVREIRRARAAGEPQSQLAARLGLSRGTVCNVASGRQWRHVA